MPWPVDALPYPFELTFMQRALVAGVIVGIFAPMIGTFLVQKRMSLIGDGIGHVAFAGVGAGLLAGMNANLLTYLFGQPLTDRGDLEGRKKMAQASLEAGLAFSNAILGATHAMSHQVGGLLDAPHGVVNGVLLSHVIRFNAEAAPERFRAIAAAVGLPVTNVPADEVAEMLAVYVRVLGDEVGVPRGLRELGVTESDIPTLAESTLLDACLATNPRQTDAHDIERLFRAAL
jgi:alcohol dehydrogenase class IV